MIEIYESEFFSQICFGTRGCDKYCIQDYDELSEQLYAQMLGWA